MSGMPLAVVSMKPVDAYQAGYEAGFEAGLDAAQAAVEDERGRALTYLDPEAVTP